MLGESNSEEIAKLLNDASAWEYDSEKTYVAVASMEGIFVNQHLGEANELWIYSSTGEKIEFAGKRKTPKSGGGPERWNEMAEILSDCKAVLVSGSGEAPNRILESKNIKVITMEGLVEEGLRPIFAGKNIPKVLLRSPGKCGAGSSCGGTGMGCG
jgi:nitrogen fixation protein NifB